jgi:hypothetical protein
MSLFCSVTTVRNMDVPYTGLVHNYHVQGTEAMRKRNHISTSQQTQTYINIFHWFYSPIGSWPLIFSLMIIVTDGRTPWTSDQLVTRPLPKHRTTRTQNEHIHTPNIHALSGIWAHDPGFRACEGSSCLRPSGYRDRLRTSIQGQTEPQRNMAVGEKHNYCT